MWRICCLRLHRIARRRRINTSVDINSQFDSQFLIEYRFDCFKSFLYYVSYINFDSLTVHVNAVIHLHFHNPIDNEGYIIV